MQNPLAASIEGFLHIINVNNYYCWYKKLLRIAGGGGLGEMEGRELLQAASHHGNNSLQTNMFLVKIGNKKKIC